MKESVVAIYGSHNSTVSLAIDNKIVEVIEVERLVGKKNASLFYYDPTIIHNVESTLNWIKDYFNKKYQIEVYDHCYHDVVDLDIIKRYFPSKDYIQTSHHVNHSNNSLYQSNHTEALVLSFDGGGNDGWFNIYKAVRGQAPILLHTESVNYGVCYGMVGHYISELKHEKSYLIGNLVYAGKLMGLAGFGEVRNEWVETFNNWYKLPTGVDHEGLFKQLLLDINVPLDENGFPSVKDSRDLATTNQYCLEQNVLRILDPFLIQFIDLPVHITGGGGLNILLNSKLSETREVFIAPNPSDCGLSVGMLCGHIKPNDTVDITYSGPEAFDKDSLLQYLESYESSNNINELVSDLVKGKIIGVVRGRCEHGPRALGNRSIICNPSITGMKDILNTKVKHRESYRPFAPVVRLEDVNEYFEWNKESRWMNYCPKVKEEYKSKLDAITHIDGTARVQTVTKDQNEWLYNLLTKFKESTGVGVLLNTSFNVDGKPILNTYKDAFTVFETTELDGLMLEDTYVKKEKISEEPVNCEQSKLTVVTGLWNIGKRSFDEYLEQFKKLLDTDCSMFIYIPKEYEYIVWQKRSRINTFVKIYELEDIKSMYGEFWDKTQKIRENEDWRNQAEWLKNSPQANLEWYNPIVMSKFSMLHNVTIWDPFQSEYFMWLDAGISFTVYEKYFTEHRILDKIIPYFDPFLFLSYPYEANKEIHGFEFDAINRYAGDTVKYVCRGGLFGGRKDVIRDGNSIYWHLVNNTLNAGYMGTEESIFSIMAYQEPHIYKRYSLDYNGLIVKFAQNLLEDKIELEPIPEQKAKPINSYVDISKLKVSVYMLTFNFTHQVEHTIQTWLKHDKWLTKTRNILIDNSTNDEARITNKALCEKYNFEHIITNENTGINGGRFRAAKHFQESDSDYYLFLEDDMGIYPPEETGFCRNGFRYYIPNLYEKILKILHGSDVDFLKLSYTEVYMDNNIQVSWYNVPQDTRTQYWPDYDKLPTTGIDPNCPRTQFDKIEVIDGLSYITGDIYYANWPTVTGKKGNQKMFLDVTWQSPYEQTWMSYIFQETKKGNIKPAVLLASPVNHNRIAHYTPEERREN